MIGAHHAAAKLAGEVGILLVAFIELLLLVFYLFGSDCGRASESLEIESLVIVACCRGDGSIPESVGVIAIKRQHGAVWNRRLQLRPTGTGIERKVKTDFLSHLLQ